METEVNLAGILMKNPVMPASGTFGYGREYSNFFDLNLLGALVTKAVTLKPRAGNSQPRAAEVFGGMLNSIGLQNDGLELFLEKAIPFLENYTVPIIVNISENTIEDFAEIARRLSISKVSGLEVNVSCPNVKVGGMIFGTDPKATYDVVQAVKQSTDKPIIVKLSPNVTNIVTIARAAYDAGADSLSMINTLLGMDIDAKTGKPKINGNGMYMGGYSGAGILPVGLRCVYQVYNSGIPLPIIGIGGITTGIDAVKYIRAGATAIAIGTSTFTDPNSCPRIIREIENFMEEIQIKDINELLSLIHI